MRHTVESPLEFQVSASTFEFVGYCCSNPRGNWSDLCSNMSPKASIGGSSSPTNCVQKRLCELRKLHRPALSRDSN